MTKINEERTQGSNEPVTIETAKVIQGMRLVFEGTLKMLEALHPKVSLAPSAILDLVTGNVEGIKAIAEKKRAEQAEKEDQKDQKDQADKPDEQSVSDFTAEKPEETVQPEETVETEKLDAPATTLTVDDIAKVIVQKIKKDRSAQTKIEPLLKTYGVARVSELPPEKFESFLTDVAQI